MENDIWIRDKDGNILYDEKQLAYCKKHDLWEGFARLRKGGLNREQTKERVLEMLSEVITKDSKMTKGALIKYIRENFKEQTVYSDVGKVASKVINENTGHSFSKWQVCTTQRHLRKVK
tara:strand:- start:939 stop:1295 length:357 start_codon:yes stop_codon:yes gene_type:complete